MNITRDVKRIAIEVTIRIEKLEIICEFLWPLAFTLFPFMLECEFSVCT